MELDKGTGRDAVGVSRGVHDVGNWNAHWTLEKRDGDIDAYVKEHLPAWARIPGSGIVRGERLEAERQALREQFKAEVVPFEVLEIEGNLLLNVGINVMLDLLMGAAGTAYSNANAYLACGDSNAAAAAGQTDMQAAVNKAYVAMNVAYPSVSAQTITFQSDFAAGTGTWAWEEVGVLNGNTPPGDEILNRIASSLGTKAAGATWTLTVTITIS